MNNKVLIKVLFPEMDSEFDVFIPVNEQVWKINRMVTKSVFDLCGLTGIDSQEYLYMNKLSGKVYNNNDIIIHTDIRNGTELVMIRSQQEEKL